mgnify:CR=1 FL=1
MKIRNAKKLIIVLLACVLTLFLGVTLINVFSVSKTNFEKKNLEAVATTKDVTDLIKFCQDTVYEKFAVKLETEIKFV